jgi:hypothetical protein
VLLSAAELARIAERDKVLGSAEPWCSGNQDRRSLLAHVAWQAERLAEAEKGIRLLKEIGGYRNQERLMFESGLTKAKEAIADLRAQLAAMTADRDRYKEMNPGALAVGLGLKGIELSKERTLRLAAEAHTAELRSAIEKALEHMFDLDVSEATPNDGPAVVTYSYLGINTLRAALATPSHGAAAVLVADPEGEVWYLRGAIAGIRLLAKDGGDYALSDIIGACDRGLAWRAARGEGGAGGT